MAYSNIHRATCCSDACEPSLLKERESSQSPLQRQLWTVSDQPLDKQAVKDLHRLSFPQKSIQWFWQTYTLFLKSNERKEVGRKQAKHATWLVTTHKKKKKCGKADHGYFKVFLRWKWDLCSVTKMLLMSCLVAVWAVPWLTTARTCLTLSKYLLNC